MFSRVQNPTIERIMNNPHRRDTGLGGHALHGDPSTGFWDLYLSQAAKFDKELSESVRSNADQLLVFLC
jgi:hypothetical protein